MLSKVLQFFGILFILEMLAGLILVIYDNGLTKSSRQFSEQAVAAFSARWDFEELKRRAHPVLLSSANEEGLQNVFKVLAELGKLQAINGCDGQANISFAKNQPFATAQYQCDATFEKDKVKITFSLIKDEVWKIAGLNVNSDYLVQKATANQPAK